MTDKDTAPERATLSDVNHTNPYTGESFGRTQTYNRGRVIAADGGEADASDRNPSDEEAIDAADENADSQATDDDTMADVDHEPPNDSDQANAAYQRGNEDAE